MSTFLQLASRLRQEVGGSGTGPSTVLSQTGEYKRFVDWIATADEDIQRLHADWLFMRGSFSVNTVASDGSYTAADCSVTDLRDWRTEGMKIYLSADGVNGERSLPFMSYDNWYRLYNTGPQTDGYPVCFTIAPDQSIKLGPKPDAVYVVTGEYQKSVDTLAVDADTPIYPAEYHMAAVYRAMMKHGRYTGAAEVYDDGKLEYNKIMRQMETTQLPKIAMSGPLA